MKKERIKEQCRCAEQQRVASKTPRPAAPKITSGHMHQPDKRVVQKVNIWEEEGRGDTGHCNRGNDHVTTRLLGKCCGNYIAAWKIMLFSAPRPKDPDCPSHFALGFPGTRNTNIKFAYGYDQLQDTYPLIPHSPSLGNIYLAPRARISDFRAPVQSVE